MHPSFAQYICSFALLVRMSIVPLVNLKSDNQVLDVTHSWKLAIVFVLSLLLYWNNNMHTSDLSLVGRAEDCSVDCHPQVVGSNPTSQNSMLVVIPTTLSLNEFPSQSHCVVSIATFIGNGIEHQELVLTFNFII